MNVADKIARANVVAGYLAGTERVLDDELRDRGWPELIGDEEFDRALGDRLFRCAWCGEWTSIDNLNSPDDDEPTCLDCAASDDDYGD